MPATGSRSRKNSEIRDGDGRAIIDDDGGGEIHVEGADAASIAPTWQDLDEELEDEAEAEREREDPDAAGVTLRGGDGGGELRGGPGDDTLYGGEGNDELTGDGHDPFTGDPSSSPGDDILYGGNGVDKLWGGGGDDMLYGGAQWNLLDGGDGDDTLIGGAGEDTLKGRGGQDTLTGGAGADQFIFYAGDLDAGAEYITDFEPGVDAIIFMAVGMQQETLSDGRVRVSKAFDPPVNLYLYGGDSDDTLTGGNGNDTLTGGDGSDRLEGYTGNDSLTGGPGNDILRGGAGLDTLTGGSGSDTFVFDAGDLDDGAEYITDFESGVDTLFLASGMQSETLSDGRVRVFKVSQAPVLDDDPFGFDSTSDFGATVDIS